MIIEPGKQERKMSSYLEEKPVRVLIIFFHGIGDCFQFASIYDHLRELYPDTHFDIGLQNGLDEEVIFPDAILLNNLENIEEGYDYTFLIHFPVEIPGLTKSELCCQEELGIEPMSSYKPIREFASPLCGVHFNLTCLPSLGNTPEDVAEKIWNEIKDFGLIPIETHFEHVFHNPENVRYDFVNRHVRDCIPRISTLVGLIQSCGVFIGCVSGNFHTAMATLPHNRICFLKREIPVSRFTNENIKEIDVMNYVDGSIMEWLKSLNL